MSRLSSLTDENGSSLQIGYSDLGYLESLTGEDGVVKLFNVYDDEGRVLEQKLPEDTRVSFQYNDADQTVTSTDMTEAEA